MLLSTVDYVEKKKHLHITVRVMHVEKTMGISQKFQFRSANNSAISSDSHPSDGNYDLYIRNKCKL